jgi:hypothetical protein
MENRVVQLIGTEVYGVQREGRIATSVAYYKQDQQVEPNAYAIYDEVSEARETVTDRIVRLSALLERLRRVKVHALAGDAASVVAAEELPFPEYLFREDDIHDLEYSVEELEKLTTARTEERPAITVPADRIETSVRDLVLPFLTPDDGRYHVVVRTYHHGRTGVVKDAEIEFCRTGQYVDVSVTPNFEWEAPAVELPTPGTPLADAYQKVVEQKGENAARAIYAAVQQVANGDLKKQVELLGKAVSA